MSMCLTTGDVNLEQLVRGCLPGVSTIQLVFFSFYTLFVR